MIKKIVRKVLFWSFLAKKKSTDNQLDAYQHANINESTILINGLKIRFDTEVEDRKYVEIGEKGIINASFIFESAKGYVSIGKNVQIGGATFISRSSICIGNDVTMAWDITIYDHDSHSIFWEYRANDNKQCYNDFHNHDGRNVINKDWSNVKTVQIIVEDKVWIGFGVTILKGVKIGEGAVIGAKSVVTRDVKPWTVVAGNPARLIKTIR